MLVGLETSDDAAVCQLDDTTALIQTVDFFTPVVDDPYSFGQIAAANALSDIYAMGGQPLMALNLVCFPADLPPEILTEILLGGSDKVTESGAILAGGHSIEDPEPKYGLCVTGLVHPSQVLTNAGARPGDRLILTKPLGSGILTTAIKADMISDQALEEVTRIMSLLNNTGLEAARVSTPHACTDITGFGLAGHATEMAMGSELTLVIDSTRIPLMTNVLEYAEMGLVPGGLYKNRRHFSQFMSIGNSVNPGMIDMIFDPQTSGGLLLAVPEKDTDLVLRKLTEIHSCQFAEIGWVSSFSNEYLQLI